jgi:hypothetical protein
VRPLPPCGRELDGRRRPGRGRPRPGRPGASRAVSPSGWPTLPRRQRGAGEDLLQATRVGLVAAVDRYDPGRPNPFIAHAIACINGELRRCLRDSSWRVHMSRTLKELALQVAKARDALTATLGRSSTLTGDYLGVASWLLPDAHLPAAAPGPAPDARPAGLSADRGWGGRPGKPPGPGRRRPVVGGGRQLGSPTGRSNPDGW